jgi:hypothetical protein
MLKPDVQNRHEDQPISSDKPWSNNPARDLVLYPWLLLTNFDRTDPSIATVSLLGN